MNEEKAKKIIATYRRSKVAVIIGYIILCFAAFPLTNTVAFGVLIFICLLLAYLNASGWFFRKIMRKNVMSIIYDRLDAPLYLEVVKLSRFGERNLVYSMQGEYFAGNISAAVELCEAVRKEGGRLKKYVPAALIILANCYFDLGNDEKLSEVCREFRALKLWGFERKRMAKNISRISFFESFLASDHEACFRILDNSRKENIYQVFRTYAEARIYLATGNAERARENFAKVVSDAPNTVYAILARHAVCALDSGISYRDAMRDIGGKEINTEHLIKKNRKSILLFRIVTVCSSLLIAVCLLGAVCIGAVTIYRHNDMKISGLLLEDVYEEVEMLDAFDYSENGEIVEKMFVCVADGHIMFGSRYKTSEGEWQVQSNAFCKLSEFDGEEDVFVSLPFPTVSYSQWFWYCFCEDVSLIPEDRLYSAVYEVDGRNIVFAITESSLIGG